MVFLAAAEVVDNACQRRQTSPSTWLSCEAASAADARQCTLCREDDAVTPNRDRQTDRRVGGRGVDQVQQATNRRRRRRRNIDRRDARAQRVNARVRDNYYQTGCVARPDVQISRRMRTPAHPAAAHPFRQRTDETRRAVRPSVKATTSATCISCSSCDASLSRDVI